MNKTSLFSIVILVIVLVILAQGREYITGRPGKGESTTSPVAKGSLAAKVLVQPVEFSGDDRVFEAIGTGRARLSVEIYPAVSDEVIEIRFVAGDRVVKDLVLVQLDDRQEKLAVQLTEVELGGARSLLDRYEQAVQDGAVPQSEVDSARADVDAARVRLEQARLAMEDRRIKAPFAGIVGLPYIDPGERVSSTTLVTTLDDRSILHLDFEIPEALARAIHESSSQSQTITATTPAFPGETFSGRISALESRIDPQRRTLLVRASIDNQEDKLRPGMSFTTRWVIPGRQFPTVPEISLQWGREGSFLWAIREGKALKVPARVVARTAGRVLVDADLSAGETIVIEGTQRLRPGVPVEILGSVL